MGIGILIAFWAGGVFAATPEHQRWLDDLWAIEQVYWEQRIWPEHNPGEKPPLEQVLSRETVELRAARTLELLEWLETQDTRLDEQALQRELNRMAVQTRAPRTLERLFEALDRDPRRIARALALPRLTALWSDRIRRNQAAPAEWAGMSPAGTAEAGQGTPAARYVDPESEAHAPLVDELLLTLPPLDLARTESGSGCTDDSWSSYFVEPSRRSLHTAVWTGSEMIVWGGENGGAFDDGGRYDPATDTWTPTSLTGAPDGRYDHRAIWTGSEMIVWGGVTDSGDFQTDTGGRYNPVTDSWVATSTAGAPSPRYTHTQVWTGSEMIVWGGTDDNVDPGPGGRYNPSTDSWTTMPAFPGPDPRPYAAAVWTGNEMLVYGGGQQEATDPFELYNDLWRYRPSTNSWFNLMSPPGVERTQHTGVWTGTEFIIWGGYGLEYDEENDEYLPIELDDGYRYNNLTGSWASVSTAGNYPLPRYAHSSVWTGSEMVIYGGYNGFDSAKYNPQSGFWGFVPTGSSPASELIDNSTVWTGSEMIVWGGFGNTGVSSEGGRYNPISNGWTPTFHSDAPPPRAEHTAVWTGSEMILHGGESIGATTSYRYDPALNSWNTIAASSLSTNLELHTAVWSGTEMIVWGGFSSLPAPAERYNPTSDSWTPVSTVGAPVSRSRHTAAWTGSEMIVWGGTSGDSSGGRYDPVSDSWTTMSEVSAPGLRNHPVSAFDGSRFIVWGGYSGSTMLGDGGRYDLATDSWTPTSSTGAPQARQRHTAVWSGSEMIVWGGSPGTANSGLDTGGRYDPVADSWTPTSTVGAPPKRGRHVAVWTGSEMIVWGGRDSTQVNSGGRYDPATDSWSLTSDVRAPQRRDFHTGVWSGSELLVFGGKIFNRTPIGARYCAAACTATDWFGDGDSDGFGDASDVVSACTAPPGYVAASGDCDDGNGDVWAVPGETESLVLSHDPLGGVTTIGWNAPGAAGGNVTLYDLLRSGDPADFDSGVCFENGDSDLTANDATVPPAGSAFHYLSRAVNACPGGVGPLGNQSDGTPRTGAVCP
ncbi:hypothetical protein ABI59_00190 [Acidobacteria bacterium Mor1]|nr:hypothetical protein ABI59_00190 [Acidobacteria bacterium Mor1]